MRREIFAFTSVETDELEFRVDLVRALDGVVCKAPIGGSRLSIDEIAEGPCDGCC